MNGPDEIDCVSEMNKLNGRELGEWDKFGGWDELCEWGELIEWGESNKLDEWGESVEYGEWGGQGKWGDKIQFKRSSTLNKLFVVTKANFYYNIQRSSVRCSFDNVKSRIRCSPGGEKSLN